VVASIAGIGKALIFASFIAMRHHFHLDSLTLSRILVTWLLLDGPGDLGAVTIAV
jgi:hypothetical protein